MNNHLIEERFPEDISYGALGGPEYKTDIITTLSGHEHRNSQWRYARAKYNISYGIKNKIQIERLLSFFRSKKGRNIGFRFKDWIDYQAIGSNIGTGDGIKTDFQLIKEYLSQMHEELRVITKPVPNTVEININNENFTSGQYKVDYNKGIVKFLRPPQSGSTITASFEFDVPVRFDTDYLPITINDNNIYSCSDILLVEIKI